jgi:hypothetical protein
VAALLRQLAETIVPCDTHHQRGAAAGVHGAADGPVNSSTKKRKKSMVNGQPQQLPPQHFSRHTPGTATGAASAANALAAGAALVSRVTAGEDGGVSCEEWLEGLLGIVESAQGGKAGVRNGGGAAAAEAAAALAAQDERGTKDEIQGSSSQQQVWQRLLLVLRLWGEQWQQMPLTRVDQQRTCGQAAAAIAAAVHAALGTTAAGPSAGTAVNCMALALQLCVDSGQLQALVLTNSSSKQQEAVVKWLITCVHSSCCSAAGGAVATIVGTGSPANEPSNSSSSSRVAGFMGAAAATALLQQIIGPTFIVSRSQSQQQQQQQSAHTTASAAAAGGRTAIALKPLHKAVKAATTHILSCSRESPGQMLTMGDTAGDTAAHCLVLAAALSAATSSNNSSSGWDSKDRKQKKAGQASSSPAHQQQQVVAVQLELSEALQLLECLAPMTAAPALLQATAGTGGQQGSADMGPPPPQQQQQQQQQQQGVCCVLQWAAAQAQAAVAAVVAQQVVGHAPQDPSQQQQQQQQEQQQLVEARKQQWQQEQEHVMESAEQATAQEDPGASAWLSLVAHLVRQVGAGLASMSVGAVTAGGGRLEELHQQVSTAVIPPPAAGGPVDPTAAAAATATDASVGLTLQAQALYHQLQAVRSLCIASVNQGTIRFDQLVGAHQQLLAQLTLPPGAAAVPELPPAWWGMEDVGELLGGTVLDAACSTVDLAGTADGVAQGGPSAHVPSDCSTGGSSRGSSEHRRATCLQLLQQALLISCRDLLAAAQRPHLLQLHQFLHSSMFDHRGRSTFDQGSTSADVAWLQILLLVLERGGSGSALKLLSKEAVQLVNQVNLQLTMLTSSSEVAAALLQPLTGNGGSMGAITPSNMLHQQQQKQKQQQQQVLSGVAWCLRCLESMYGRPTTFDLPATALATTLSAVAALWQGPLSTAAAAAAAAAAAQGGVGVGAGTTDILTILPGAAAAATSGGGGSLVALLQELSAPAAVYAATTRLLVALLRHRTHPLKRLMAPLVAACRHLLLVLLMFDRSTRLRLTRAIQGATQQQQEAVSAGCCQVVVRCGEQLCRVYEALAAAGDTLGRYTHLVLTDYIIHMAGTTQASWRQPGSAAAAAGAAVTGLEAEGVAGCSSEVAAAVRRGGYALYATISPSEVQGVHRVVSQGLLGAQRREALRELKAGYEREYKYSGKA